MEMVYKIMSNIHFQLVTPEKTVLSKELASLSCPTTMGQITILPNHSQLVATLAPGELHAKTASEEFFIHVSGGFVEVREGNNVIVLADSA
jgi:F-type H+-transporting ATPase subunit epsilon